MTPTVPQPVLVYDRIAQNRRTTVVLVAIAIASILPFVGAASFVVSEWFVRQFGHHTEVARAQERNLRAGLSRRYSGVETEWSRELERKLDERFQEERKKLDEEEAADQRARIQMFVVVAGGLSALLGLLFWNIASAPTAKVLAMCGARPGGQPESEARRLLENLAIGAGLPTPKLYVIDSPTPNAFAAGPDPEHSVVAVTQGLLMLLDHRELEGVLAHELSHIGNHDTRLNTLVLSIALFLRMPYLLVKRRIQQRIQGTYQPTGTVRRSRFRMVFTFAMLPALIYIFVIAPILAALIRSAISRSREFLADADAALLTRYPEGLLRALAKIGGASSPVAGSNPVIAHLYFADPAPGVGIGILRGGLFATHPPIQQRLMRLMEFNGGAPISVLEGAVKAGKEFLRNHPPLTEGHFQAPSEGTAQDEISVLTAGNPMGRVVRVLTATKLYDRPDLKSCEVARVPAGALVVLFDDPGKFRQVLTHDQTFGYMPLSVKFQKVDMIPAEVFDPGARKAMEAAQIKAQAAAPAAPGLTGTQIAIATVFGLVLFGGILLVLVRFGG